MFVIYLNCKIKMHESHSIHLSYLICTITRGLPDPISNAHRVKEGIHTGKSCKDIHTLFTITSTNLKSPIGLKIHVSGLWVEHHKESVKPGTFLPTVCTTRKIKA